jgi:formylmethanofuran dehydrogenase subunit B
MLMFKIFYNYNQNENNKIVVKSDIKYIKKISDVKINYNDEIISGKEFFTQKALLSSLNSKEFLTNNNEPGYISANEITNISDLLYGNEKKSILNDIGKEISENKKENNNNNIELWKKLIPLKIVKTDKLINNQLYYELNNKYPVVPLE